MADALTVHLHDGKTIEAEADGDGPVVLLPVNPVPIEGERAEELRRWGADPALGHNLRKGLTDRFRVVAFDYEGHVLAHPKPHTLTPSTVAADILAVADAFGAERFAYYGYSWLALGGLHLAARTGRLTALAIGGYPPVDQPTEQMLQVTRATHAMPRDEPNGGTDWDTAAMTLSTDQTRQFVTFYEAVRDEPEPVVTGPRLCFVGSADEITYSQRWGGVRVSLAAPVVQHRLALQEQGWRVEILDGLDHTGAMQAAVVTAILRPWLAETLL